MKARRGFGMDDEVRQLAMLVLSILLIIFFLLVLRTRLDRGGRPEEPNTRRFMTNPSALRSKILARIPPSKEK